MSSLINGGVGAKKGFIAIATGRRTGTAGLIGGRQNPSAEAMLINSNRTEAGLRPINQRRCSMPVPHNLYEDLRWTKEEIQKKSANDPLLSSLLTKYSEADADVVKAETATSDAPSDDVLKRLKEKRLQVKDKIVEQLQATTKGQ